MICRTLLTLLTTALIAITATSVRASDAWISVEVVTERGVQATAQREWLELLTAAGADHVQLRGVNPGDEPVLRQSGTDDRPRYSLVGLLDGRGHLTLPGGRFDTRSRAKLKDYLERLAADGSEGVTAPTGAFGLTEKQTVLMHDDLALPMQMETTGRSLADVLKDIDQRTKLDLRMDDAAWKLVREAEPVADDVESLTIGTALTILLKRDGLVLVPTKEQGEAVVHRVARTSDIKGETWPVGWKPRRSPSQLAPEMQEYLNAEVEGFTLAEAMESIVPRMGVPVYWDHATLRAKKIDPAKIDVKLARQKTRLMRVINLLLFQGRLRGELMVDEAGTAFYWISR